MKSTNTLVDKVVCKCFGVTEQDVKDYMTKNPNSSTEDLVQELRIGEACGCCKNESCKRIDIHFSKVVS